VIVALRRPIARRNSGRNGTSSIASPPTSLPASSTRSWRRLKALLDPRGGGQESPVGELKRPVHSKTHAT
jgi:hypothetical protein